MQKQNKKQKNGGCLFAQLTFLNQRNEAHHENQHVKIRTAINFCSCQRTNTRNGRHLKTPKIRVGTRSHGSEGGRARECAWELVDFWSITCCPIKGKKIIQQRMRLAQLVSGSFRRIRSPNLQCLHFQFFFLSLFLQFSLFRFRVGVRFSLSFCCQIFVFVFCFQFLVRVKFWVVVLGLGFGFGLVYA